MANQKLTRYEDGGGTRNYMMKGHQDVAHENIFHKLL